MDPVEGSAETRGERVGDAHNVPSVAGLLEVPMLHIPVAEVVPELNVRRHLPGQAQQTLQDARPDVLKPDRKDTLQHPELEVRVPLDGELVVGHILENESQLAEQSVLI